MSPLQLDREQNQSRLTSAATVQGRNAQTYLQSFLILGAVCAHLSAHACSVPVFRYALDHWHGDLYRLEVPEGVMNGGSAARLLRPLGIGSGANVKLETITGSQARLLRPDKADSIVWSGTLNESSVAAIAQSPARADLVQRILAGHSIVWVLVESGSKAANDTAATTLEKRLAFLKNVTELPVMDPSDPSNKLGPGPELKIQFSLLRVRNDDPAEGIFLNALAGPKPETGLRDGPWLAAVFGRGRVLGAWPAEGFGDEQIDEVSLFLLGACSCQVKNLNPGWDLLLQTDWDQALMQVNQKRLEASATEPATQSKPNSAEEPQTAVISPTTISEPPITQAPEADSQPAPGQRTVISIAAIALLGLGIGLFILSSKRAP